MGCRTEGNPIKGFPAGRSPAKTHKQKPHQREETVKRFDSLARFLALDKFGVRHAAISTKLRPRGHPRAACGPPFFLFWVAPEAQRVEFRPLGRATKGAAFGNCQPFEKGWTENLFLFTLQDIPYAQTHIIYSRIRTKNRPRSQYRCKASSSLDISSRKASIYFRASSLLPSHRSAQHRARIRQYLAW